MSSFVRARPDGAIPAFTPAFSDSFKRVDGPLDNADGWVLRSGTAGVVSNQLKASTTGVVAACTTDATAAHIVSLAAPPAWFVCARLGPSGTDRYEFGYDFNRFKIRKWVGGTAAATVQGAIAAAPAAPFVIELAVIDVPGPRVFLTGRVNGVASVLMTDSSSPLTGTLAGVSCSSNGAVADDFGMAHL